MVVAVAEGMTMAMKCRRHLDKSPWGEGRGNTRLATVMGAKLRNGGECRPDCDSRLASGVLAFDVSFSLLLMIDGVNEDDA